MTAFQLIQSTLCSAAKCYETELQIYKPWRCNGDIHESNLAFQVGKAWASLSSSHIVATEIPVPGINRDDDGEKGRERLDLYLHSPDLGILGECKNVSDTGSRFIDIFSDFARVSSTKAVAAISKGYRVTSLPPGESAAVIIVATFQKRNFDLWHGCLPTAAPNPNDRTVIAKISNLRLNGWVFDSVPVGDYMDSPAFYHKPSDKKCCEAKPTWGARQNDWKTLYWLFAVKDNIGIFSQDAETRHDRHELNASPPACAIRCPNSAKKCVCRDNNLV